LAVQAIGTERSQLARAQAHAGWLLAFPALALYFAFVLAPVAVKVILSFAY